MSILTPQVPLLTPQPQIPLLAPQPQVPLLVRTPETQVPLLVRTPETHGKIPWTPILIAVSILVVVAVFLLIFFFGRHHGTKEKARTVLYSPPQNGQPLGLVSDPSTCAPFDCTLMQEQILAGLLNTKPDASGNIGDFAILKVSNLADVNPANPESFVCGVDYTFQGKPKSRRMSFAPIPSTCNFAKDGLSLLDRGDFCDDSSCNRNATLASVLPGLAAVEQARKTELAFRAPPR